MNELERRLATGPDEGWAEARERLLARAADESLLDLVYERHETPFGTMLVVAGDDGIVRTALAAEAEDEVLEDLARRLSSRIGRVGTDELAEARRQLDEYFEGRRKRFDLSLDRRLSEGFRKRVLDQTAAIPYGETASYAEVADRAGSPRAVRAAGTALATNPLPIIVPCHRVLRSDGAVGSYLGGSSMKEALLDLERRS